jgi:hypothetical protein
MTSLDMKLREPDHRDTPLMTIDTSPEMSGDDEMDSDLDGVEMITYDTGEGDVEIVAVPRRR